MTLLETFFPEIYSNSKLDYNLVKQSDSELLLEINVAGIPETDVDVEVSGNKLTVSSTPKDEREYLYKGLPKCHFKKSFNLRDDIVVKSASVKNGLLSIVLEVQIPQEKKPRKILLTH